MLSKIIVLWTDVCDQIITTAAFAGGNKPVL